jgi:hypothetical protein
MTTGMAKFNISQNGGAVPRAARRHDRRHPRLHLRALSQHGDQGASRQVQKRCLAGIEIHAHPCVSTERPLRFGKLIWPTQGPGG